MREIIPLVPVDISLDVPRNMYIRDEKNATYKPLIGGKPACCELAKPIFICVSNKKNILGKK